jgi:superfamily II DNA/RNA helicase
MFIENLPKEWQEKWQDQQFLQPTLIQDRSFSLLRNEESIFGVSPTGSGKTLAYLLPLLLKVEPGKGNQLLILLPTQELAMQVVLVAREWGSLLSLKVESLIGGANLIRQIERLKKKKSEVLIGTPGRILELIRTKKIQLMKIETIVMDEVDHLFSEKEGSFTQKILSYVPKDFQLVFFSATGSKIFEQVKKLTTRSIKMFDVTQEDTSQGEIFHKYLKVFFRKRVEELRRLSYVEGFWALIFFNKLSDLGAVSEKLEFLGLPVAHIASDQSKITRKATLKKFRKGEIKLLLTTEILARGLDFQNLPYVVNFEPPLTVNSYIHRAGRIGRMGNEGKVLTFVQDGNLSSYRKLVKSTGNEISEIFLHGGKLLDEFPKKDKMKFKRLEKNLLTSRKENG